MIYNDKRKEPRVDINIKLKIKSLYKDKSDVLLGIDEIIEVKDISKKGIGFFCEHDLPIDYYFDANIIIDNEKHFFSVLKIIRKIEKDKGYDFGCEFIGLADVLSSCIDDLI